MAKNTKIEWATHTLNPWIGCTKISPGCDGCYAEALMDKRMHKVQWGAGNPRDRTSAANWNMPLKWNANHDAFFAEHGYRQRVFCASLADVFDNAVDPQWLSDLFELIRRTPNLDWLLLTKRIGNWKSRMQAVHDHLSVRRPPTPKPRSVTDEESDAMNWVDAWLRNDVDPIPANVWLGATIVNQEEANRDIPKLLQVPAAKRFLSIEPLLGDVTIFDLDGPIDVPDGMKSPIDWVIVGGESGPGARPMHPDWARSLRDQCEAAGVPFLFKQWGEWLPGSQADESDGVQMISLGRCQDGHRWHNGTTSWKLGKKIAGRLLDGRTWDGAPS